MITLPGVTRSIANKRLWKGLLMVFMMQAGGRSRGGGGEHLRQTQREEIHHFLQTKPVISKIKTIISAKR